MVIFIIYFKESPHYGKVEINHTMKTFLKIMINMKNFHKMILKIKFQKMLSFMNTLKINISKIKIFLKKIS
jgi:hypothetical protein